jgi:hypothetical protein
MCEEQEVTAPSKKKEAVTAANSDCGKKRIVDDNNANGTVSKRSQKKKAVTTTNSGRVFSEEDGRVIQNDMVEFISKTGNVHFKDSKAFHSFMKDSIDAEISTTKTTKMKGS